MGIIFYTFFQHETIYNWSRNDGILMAGCAEQPSEPAPEPENAGVQVSVEETDSSAPDNTARITQYLEEDVLEASQGGVIYCAYEDLGPALYGNEVSLWAFCQERAADGNPLDVAGASLNTPLQIRFASPSMHSIPQNDEEKALLFTEDQIQKIENAESFLDDLAAKLRARVQEKAVMGDVGVFEIEETFSDAACSVDEDCSAELGADYFLRSDCPYELRCIDRVCAVGCPSRMGSELGS